MSRLLATASLLAALAVSACGGDNPSTPTTPTATTAITPATTALAVTQTQTYTLSATTTPTSVTWVSGNTNALTIDSSGNATAVGVGASTITATDNNNAAQTATLTVQTVPLYQGNWAGTATVIACTDLVGFTSAGYCASNLGTTQQVTLNLTQSGLTVSGSMSKSEGGSLLSGPISGTTGIAGDITLTGILVGVVNSSNVALALISWNSYANGASMTGTWAGTVTSPQTLGSATLQWSLKMTKAP
jgi:hypothetical protein